MSVRSSRENDNRFAILGVAENPVALLAACLARLHLPGSTRIIASAWVRPMSFAGTTGAVENRVFTSHLGGGTTGFTFGFNPDGSAYAGARPLFQSAGTVDPFVQVTSTLKIQASGMTMKEWHLIGMYADFLEKKIGVFIDGEWTEASAPSWTSTTYSTNYVPTVATDNSYDGLGGFHTAQAKYTANLNAHFDGYVSHLWIPRVSTVGVVPLSFRWGSSNGPEPFSLMWRRKLSPRAFFSASSINSSYGHWPLSSGATLGGPRYAISDSLRMTLLNGTGNEYFADPPLQHILKATGIRRAYAAPLAPTLSAAEIAYYTSTTARPRVTLTF